MNLTDGAKNKLAAAHTKMHRSMSHVINWERKLNICVRENTTAIDVNEPIRRRKCTQAVEYETPDGIVRLSRDQIAHIAIEWTPECDS